MIVLLLRVPCRRWFGAQRAFQLWLLVPLMLLLAAWSQAPSVGASGLPPVVLRIVTAPAGWSASAVDVSHFDGRATLLLGWAGGVPGTWCSPRWRSKRVMPSSRPASPRWMR